MEPIEPLTHFERIEKALEEGYQTARDATKAMEQFHTISVSGENLDSLATIESTLDPLIAKLTSAHLFMEEAREWFTLAKNIFAQAKLEAEND